ESIELTEAPIEFSPTPSPSPTPTAEADGALVETAPPSSTPGPPTAPPPPTAPLGPYEHTITAGDTLLYIIQLYGYREASVLSEVVRMNDNILNADSLPGVGSVILIPRQTVTPTPDGFELTPTDFVPEQAIAPTNEETGLNVDT